jgi:hypothetical protein
MITNLVITDLTRMQHGHVCIVGYDAQHNAVRPVLPLPGIAESALCQAGEPAIFPFALVAFDLHEAVPQPPHCEDVRFTPGSPKLVRVIQSREAVLHWSLFNSVPVILGQPVLCGPGYYVLDGQGERSLGTMQPSTVEKVVYTPGDEAEAWDYRIVFKDGTGQVYKLKITDLSWQHFCHSLRGESLDPPAIAARMTQTLQERRVYLGSGYHAAGRSIPSDVFCK